MKSVRGSDLYSQFTGLIEEHRGLPLPELFTGTICVGIQKSDIFTESSFQDMFTKPAKKLKVSLAEIYKKKNLSTSELQKLKMIHLLLQK